jgi:hypothetical protein
MTKEKINLITKDLFSSKKEKDCLTTIRGKLAYNGKILDTAQVSTIISQAKEIRNMDLYQLLTSELEVLANKKMYFESEDEMGILFGKAVLWTVDILRKKVDKLAEM